MSSEQDILEILGILGSAYPRYKLSPQTISVYCTLLADLDADALRMAALECATSKTFFPSVYEIRAAAVQLDRRSNNVPSAAEAWQELLDAPSDGMVREIADYKTDDGHWIILEDKYRFSHPLIEKVARNMGWPKRFWTNLLASDRSRFMNAYEAELDIKTSEALSLPEVRGYVRGQLTSTKEIRQLVKGMVK